MKNLALMLSLMLCWATSHAQELQSAPEGATGSVQKKIAFAKHEMVAAVSPQAVDAGLAILKRGGTAMDAAVAVQMVLNLTEPQSTGIGGGAFIVYYDAKKKKTFAYDGRETAPASATPTMFLDTEGKPLKFFDAVVGGKSVGVPGVLRVLELAHARHGKLPWSVSFQPAIKMASAGFPFSPRTSALAERDQKLREQAAARDYFYDANGKAKAPGTLMKNPQFAEVLKRVAKEGANAFYKGEIARDIAATVRAHPTNPGGMTEDDLANYHAVVREPLCGNYRQYHLCGFPPPGSGGVAVLQMLGMLERFDMKNIRPNSSQAVHLFSEAGRLAYADRAQYLADDGFVEVPTAALIDPAYLESRSQLIAPEKSMGIAKSGVPLGVTVSYTDDNALEFPATSHFSIVDRYGNALAMTTTIETGFGSHQMVRGFLLNNELTDFSFNPIENGKPVANSIAPGKRPRSAMAPFIVFDEAGKVQMVIGSPGGSTIINYVAKTLVATLDWNMDIQAAIALPNMGSRNGPTELEKGTVVENISAALQAMGHEVRLVDLTSGLHGIMRTKNGWLGGADPRREGLAKGN